MKSISVIYYLIIGCIIGFSISQIFGCSNKPAVLKPVTQMTDQNILLESKYAGTIRDLAEKNEVLTGQIQKTDGLLSTANTNNHRLTQRVKSLLNELDATEDTASTIPDCDSLQLSVRELLNAHDEVDSLNNVLISSLNEKIATLDSTIAVQQIRYSEATSSLNASLEAQRALNETIRQYQVSDRRHRRKQKILQVALLIAGSMASYGILSH